MRVSCYRMGAKHTLLRAFCSRADAVMYLSSQMLPLSFAEFAVFSSFR